ncbi:hypothetical protein KC887_03565 [Candidatus Kaiserbacteria bacterium]|nr:hypothetical protein [Candidatus Kaiserbacteria bacterium]
MMLTRAIAIVSILFLPLCPVFAQVDSSQFIISFWGGADTTPPPTPTINSATPTTDTQIDIVWGAVVDDMALAGYVVFRDGVPVATTTLTNYSDTGLLASTTYSYTVRAFDGAYNYSSSSAAVATTTLQTPPPPPVATTTPTGGGSSSGTAVRPVLDSFTVNTGISTTSLAMQFAMPTRIEVRWGQTSSYELGASIGSIYRRDHRLLITDLTPHTTYYYEVIGTMPNGVSMVVKSGSFITQGVPIITAPTNVSHFTAVGIGNNVELSWQLPNGVPGATVRVVRNYYGFSAFPTDGAVIYQGTGSQFIDRAVLATRSPVYYTAFVFDAYGNVSSGAVAMVVAEQIPGTSGTAGLPDTSTPPTLPDGTFVTEATSSTEVASTVTPPVVVPLLSELYIAQGDMRVTFADRDISLDSSLPFTLIVPKEVVGGAFKSIIGTMVDPTDTRKEFSFLLRINQDQTAYEATIAPVGVLGASTLAISIYNYDTLKVASYKTPVTFVAAASTAGLFASNGWLWWLWIILLLLILWWLFGLRRKLREDKVARS